jgi:GNAT superfamily N-acetyltransferase
MTDIKIRRATRGHAEELTRIAFGAKRHRGYLEPSIERWASALTISPRFADTNEVWVAMLEEQEKAFCRLSGERPEATLEHLRVLPAWIGRGVGSRSFPHAVLRCR